MPRRSDLRAASLAASALLLAVAPGTSAAQTTTRPLPDSGAQVRVRVAPPNGEVIQGTLLRLDASGMLIAPANGGGSRTVPLAAVRRLDVPLPPRSAGAAFGRGALVGAGVGLGIGVLATGAAFLQEQANPCGDCFVSATVVLAVLTVPLTAATTLVGGAIGLGFRDRWQVVPLAPLREASLGAMATPSGAVAVGLRIPIGR